MRMMKLHTNKVLVNIEKSDFSVCFKIIFSYLSLGLHKSYTNTVQLPRVYLLTLSVLNVHTCFYC